MAEAKVRRWNAVAESAAKQSGRMIIPEVTDVVSFSKACKMAGQMDCGLIPYELARGMDEAREVFGRIRPGMQVGILIGPEGGFDMEEIEEAQTEGILPVTLGRRILRTETAGMAALSILMFHLEQ